VAAGGVGRRVPRWATRLGAIRPWPLLALLLLLAACSDSDSGGDATATGAAGTGVPGLDGLIDTLLQRDAGAIQQRAHLVPVPCVEGRPGPSCPTGASVASPVPSFLWVRCESEYVTSDAGVREAIDTALGGAHRLYAVARGSSYEEGWGLGDEVRGGYVVLLTRVDSQDEPLGSLWLVDDAFGIVGLAWGCDQPGAGNLRELANAFVPGGDYLIPPPAQ
jgi:hypothetical protein